MDLNSSPFQKGLYVKVPKGTPLINRWNGTSTGVTSKEVTVEISHTALPNAETMLTQVEKDERERRQEELRNELEKIQLSLSHKVHYPARQVNNGRGGTYTYDAYDRMEIIPEKEEEWSAAWQANHKADSAIREEYIKLGESRFTPDDVIVFWTNDNKAAFAKHLQLAEKPEARKKQPKVNLRQQMVNKSRWKFAQDVDIMYGAENPKYKAALTEWKDANPCPSNTRTDAEYKVYHQWHQDHLAKMEELKESLGEYTPTLYRSIKAGEIFTVCGKFHTYFMPYGYYGEKYTNAAVALFDGEKNAVCLEYSHIKDYIEAESIPTVDVWVLRHKPTQTYYKASNYNRWEENGDQPFDVNDQEMVDTFMKGKKWDNLGRAKTSILSMTGYYVDLPGSDEAMPEWDQGGKTFNLDEDWELVKFDKLARKEIGPVEDFHEWFKRTWELRALTVKFGSSVRTCYKALEKANLLDSQKGMVVFTETNEDKLDAIGYHGDKTAITPEEKQLIASAVASLKLKKGTFKQAVDHKSLAVSFANKSAALMFKLAYQGNLKVTALDLETLKEEVDG
jgi:hypothetical protein